MFPPALTGSGASLLVTDRCARVMTPVVAVAELFPGHGSEVSLVAVAVWLSVVPFGGLAFTLPRRLDVADPAVSVLLIDAPSPAVTLTTSVKLAVAPLPNVVTVQLIAPLPPTIGFRHVQSAGQANETNVVSVGIMSLTVTAIAASGPA